MSYTESIAEWGIVKLAFAIRNSDGTYETPVVHPGGITFNVSAGEASNNALAADNNGKYYRGAGSKTKSGELTVAKFTEWFLENILGQVVEGEGLGEGAAEGAEFAMLWETDSDQGGTRSIWYSCTAGDIAKNYATTSTDGTVTYATETSTITSSLTTLPNNNKRRKWTCQKGSANYDNFFDAVYYPAAAVNPSNH